MKMRLFPVLKAATATTRRTPRKIQPSRAIWREGFNHSRRALRKSRGTLVSATTAASSSEKTASETAPMVLPSLAASAEASAAPRDRPRARVAARLARSWRQLKGSGPQPCVGIAFSHAEPVRRPRAELQQNPECLAAPFQLLHSAEG